MAPTTGKYQRESLFFALGDVEEAELVDGGAGGDHVKVITELLLLEELLGQVLKLALGEGHGGVDADGLGVAGHLDGVAEVTAGTVDFDALLQVRGEDSGVDEVRVLIVGVRAVDHEGLAGDFGCLGHNELKVENDCI